MLQRGQIRHYQTTLLITISFILMNSGSGFQRMAGLFHYLISIQHQSNYSKVKKLQTLYYFESDKSIFAIRRGHHLKQLKTEQVEENLIQMVLKILFQANPQQTELINLYIIPNLNEIMKNQRKNKLHRAKENITLNNFGEVQENSEQSYVKNFRPLTMKLIANSYPQAHPNDEEVSTRLNQDCLARITYQSKNNGIVDKYKVSTKQEILKFLASLSFDGQKRLLKFIENLPDNQKLPNYMDRSFKNKEFSSWWFKYRHQICQTLLNPLYRPKFSKAFDKSFPICGDINVEPDIDQKAKRQLSLVSQQSGKVFSLELTKEVQKPASFFNKGNSQTLDIDLISDLKFYDLQLSIQNQFKCIEPRQIPSECPEYAPTTHKINPHCGPKYDLQGTMEPDLIKIRRINTQTNIERPQDNCEPRLDFLKIDGLEEKDWNYQTDQPLNDIALSVKTNTNSYYNLSPHISIGINDIDQFFAISPNREQQNC